MKIIANKSGFSFNTAKISIGIRFDRWFGLRVHRNWVGDTYFIGPIFIVR